MKVRTLCDLCLLGILRGRETLGLNSEIQISKLLGPNKVPTYLRGINTNVLKIPYSVAEIL